MPITIAINGFGRIGRAALKIALSHEDANVVAINDLGDIENLAYLLRFDSVYGRYGVDVQVEGNCLIVGGKKITVLQEKDPANLPWKEMAVDVVIESTGFFTEEDGACKHITAGAKHVVVSAPTKSEGIATVVMGVNDDQLAGKDIVSNASCTTNCAAPVMAVLHNVFGVEKALLTTAHAYTATQSLVDSPAKGDFRRGRAAAINMVPSSTGAAIAATLTIPELKGKFDGISLRIPVPVVSMSDITCVVSRDVTVEEVNNAFTEAVDNPMYQGVLAVSDSEAVSSDFIGDPHSAIVDLPLTRVVGGNLVKVMAWYDNEWGYSNRLIEQVLAVGKT
ncbi:MAG: type I glyceraldehyde-3-phosphate dehydrogenase [Candidatus Andersenbacteria bacterium RIFCSPHIGHO2_02_FULL_45_11]|uniref:Type I glyceraldehyde-3-phosphate dehydrogenase n=1 Tax=Candidatus Andersenbacteria bacterium RIFCSPHIGHO2_12_FULL_45_11 TaxID=1797281 RepID=A0A1G1X453_9BACT|nr:MAG: type I glyceraldehyde-3-phosphate dehydrogenase [Candidatus Andersenbacteria bacterium RIFCSPHIGHO2_01_FULL_46_36]OGY34107.1 MAG: type I glyceraldehyde-3-phosphate dehydrogenase [Candidatus Andersenbacteria bacterium RIFCSPHIGHO2_12_FULL_45_11]OGY34232.1 MAG: type I glyceraldehyde-3-phosphate dehydrogenase [Candidatus Andersenbacteria bacterium RIFCSPHIGHO2_02_FULL_45_11]